MNCFTVLRKEINPCQAWFRVKETEPDRELDIKASFGPNRSFALLAKFLSMIYTISTLVYALIETPRIDFYFAFYTSWALVLAVIYSIASFTCSLIPLEQPEDDVVVQGRVKFTWLFFVLASVMQFLVTALFWALVYDGFILEYLDVASHGIVFVVILLDGFLVNRIPFRWTHIWAIMVISATCILWSILHGPLVLDLGNPNSSDQDPDTNDDALYASLSWQGDDIPSTVVLCLIVYFIVVPVFFIILRALSIRNWFCLADGRRYVDNDNSAVKSFGVEESTPHSSVNEQEEGHSDLDQDVEAGLETINIY